MSAPPDANAVLLMDRFVSASSPQDAVESLASIVKGLRDEGWSHDWIFDHGELLESLLQLLQNGTIGGSTECEDGVPLVCQIFLELKSHPMVLQKPAPCRLLEALLDVMESSDARSDGNNATGSFAPKSAYIRVLALKVLAGISKASISTASSQWMEAPNGLYRLADLIDNDTEEMVRNEALLVLRVLATQAQMAKLFLFAELDVKLLDFCWHIGGGLTNGNTIVLDALGLIHELYKHADASMQDLVWQRPAVAPRLAQLLDLRGGDEFLNPREPKSKSQNDDLDDLMKSSSLDKKKEDSQPLVQIVPHLLPAEEKVIKLVLQILDQLLDSESLRGKVWKQHFSLCSLVWELALIGPPVQPPIFSRPSPQLQQAALELVAQKFNDTTLMDRLSGIDRLLFLVVTGGNQSNEDNNNPSATAVGISQAALAVLRNTLDATRVHELLLHTLAPPPVDEDDTSPKPSPGPTVVQKLWNTVAQNLPTSFDENDKKSKLKNRSLFLSGALGGLALLLKTEESREMMFKAMTVTMDQFLETLETEKDEMVQWTLSRFLCEWIFQSPLLVQSLLSSTMSTHLASMASTKGKSNPLLYLLLGLAMDSMADGTTQCGGWTREGILQVLQSIGIAKITDRLESLKKKTKEFPWSECVLEYKHWEDWYQKAVWIVRKRIVGELAKSSSGDSSEEEGDETAATPDPGDSSVSNSKSVLATITRSSGSSKALHKLLNQQSREMEELRHTLEQAQARIVSQDVQLETWKRRMESTPTELDAMLNEFTAKTAQLEETIKKMQDEAKNMQIQHDMAIKEREEALQEQRQENERLRNEEQESREDRDRMEQELQGLSQAYASLEEEFRQHTSSSASGAPTGEDGDFPRQSQGEDSQQTANTGSTETATLREEISRLRNENNRLRNSAMEADNWMNMAVQRMNDMGARNANLEQQVATLQDRCEQTQKSSNDGIDQVTPLQNDAIQAQLEKEVALRHGIEAQLNIANGEIKLQQQKISQLESQLSNTEMEFRSTLEKTASEKTELEREKEGSKQPTTEANANATEMERISYLEQQLSKTREELQVVMTKLETENVNFQLELNAARQELEVQISKGTELESTIEQLHKDLTDTIVAKNNEIKELESSLDKAKSAITFESTTAPHVDPQSSSLAANIQQMQHQLDSARKETEEVNRRSQEEIYKRESRIRELEDRLKNGLGGYNMEDIKMRDEEIEELRAANEAAQEWMSKAVEHHQLLTNQVRSLTEEKNAIRSQLEKLQGQTLPSDASKASLKLFESQLQQASSELQGAKTNLSNKEQEITSLKGTINDLEQDLEIARDDLANLRRQLDQAQATVHILESRLAENPLVAENESLRSSNEDMNDRLREFQAWADMAQTKIADILAAKDNAEQQLATANERLNTNERSLAALDVKLNEKNRALEELQEQINSGASEAAATRVSEAESAISDELQRRLAALELTNKSLSEEREFQKIRVAELERLYDESLAKLNHAQREIDVLRAEGYSCTPREGNERTSGADVCYDAANTPGDELQRGDSKVEMRELNTLEKAYKELQIQTEAAQNKISGLIELKTDLERALAAAKEEIVISRDEIDCLKKEISSSTAKTDSAFSPEKQEPGGNVDDAIDFFKCTESADQSNAAADFFGSNEKTRGNDNAQKFFGSEENTIENVNAEALFGSHGNDVEKEHSGSFLGSQEKPTETASAETLFGSIEEPSVGNVVDFLQRKLRRTEEELKAIQDHLTLDENIVKKSEELENEVTSLQGRLKEQEEEANNVIIEWQERLAEFETRYFKLEAERDLLQKETEFLKSTSGGLEKDRADIGPSTRELDEKIASLEHAIDEEIEEINEEGKEKEKNYSIEDLRKELELAQAALSKDEEVVLQWEDRVAELECTIDMLQKQLQDQEEEANNVISQWQESYNESDRRCAEIQKELESAQSAKESSISNIESYYGEHELLTRVKELERRLKEAQEALASDEDVVKQWEARVIELEATIESLDVQLKEQEHDAEEAISEWQKTAAAAEGKCQEVEEQVCKLIEERAVLQSTLKKVEEDKESLSARVSTLQEALDNMRGDSNYSELNENLLDRLSKAELELVEAKQMLSQDEEVLQQWEVRSAAFEAQIQSLESQLNEQEDEAKTALQQWQDSYSEIEAKLSSTESAAGQREEELFSQLKEKDSELRAALETIERDEDIVKQWEGKKMIFRQLGYDAYEPILQYILPKIDRVAELTSTVEELRNQLQEQESEAESVISAWQEKYSELEEQCLDLESQLSSKEDELKENVSTIKRLQSQLDGFSLGSEEFKLSSKANNNLEKNLEDYIAENTRLQTQIASEKESRAWEIERLEAELADEKNRYAEARDEIEELTKSIELVRNESEDVVNGWTERVDELTCAVQDLELQLQQQETDANEAISSWEKKADELEKELESLIQLMSELKTVLNVEDDSMILEAVEEVLRDRENAKRASSVRIDELKCEVETLQNNILVLEETLETKGTIIEKLQSEKTKDKNLLSDVKKQLDDAKIFSEELEKDKETLTKSKESVEAQCVVLEEKEVNLKKRIDDLEKQLRGLQEDRKKMKELLADKSREKLEEDRDRLAVVIAQLEEELREANEMVQAYVTDGSSKKATEIAAQALRDEIEYLRCQVDEYRAVAENEKAAREAGDVEIERLRDDISALIALGDQGVCSDDIQVLTAKASEKLKVKERQEIEQIRKSLYRAIDELELARAAEKDANEKLSKARLQNAVCEQEIVAAKSEIIFLTQTLEDMRLNEEGKRASFEHRINSLEDENEVIRKYNTDELQSVRNELAQVVMERDRISSQLKESEKTNEALVLSASKGELGDNGEREEPADLEAEVARLRVENAYLLTISANDKARAERRLRELIGAQTAATEADTILEHELRIAAEANVKTLKVEIEELKKRLEKGNVDGKTSRSSHTKSTNKIDSLATEVDHLKKEVQKLKKENSNLKSKLEQEALKAREKIENLTEQCRQAQAKSHKLERQGRFDAAVKSEIARSRASPGMSTPERRVASHDGWMLVNNDPATDRPEAIITSAEAFDLIRKQKDEIQEERQMYLEFLAEHEDLLALLAQHDIERACLKKFMIEKLGEDAVDEAIREAEEKSREKFGQVLRSS